MQRLGTWKQTTKRIRWKEGLKEKDSSEKVGSDSPSRNPGDTY